MTIIRCLTTLLALALSSVAIADKPRATPPPEPSPAPTTVTADATAEAGANANATGGNPTAIVSARDRLQAPGTFVGNATTTADCYYIDTWGGSLPGAGLTRGKSKLDEDCVRRKNAELLIAAGYPRLAALVLAGHELTPADIPDDGSPPAAAGPLERACEERVERVVQACAKGL